MSSSKVFLFSVLAVSIGLAACSKKADSDKSGDAGTFSFPDVVKGGDLQIRSYDDRTPFQRFVGSAADNHKRQLFLGFGTEDVDSRRLSSQSQISKAPCLADVQSKARFYSESVFYGGFGNSVPSFFDVYNHLSPFEFDSRCDSAHDTCQLFGGFVDMAESLSDIDSRTNSVSFLSFGGVFGSHYFDGNYVLNSKIEPTCESAAGQKNLKRIIAVVEYGGSAYSLAQVSFDSAKDLTGWMAETNDQKPVEFIFSSEPSANAKISDAQVQKLLMKYRPRLTFSFAQVGGTASLTESAIRDLKCSFENLKGCRNVFSTLQKSIQKQWMLDQPMSTEKAQALEPVRFTTGIPISADAY